MEVAEHIPLQFESAFLANIEEHATRGVVLSWSDGWGNGHVNNRPSAYVRFRLASRGFVRDHAQTHALRASVATSPFYWLRETLEVYVE
eukprot:4602648-Prymnesium_polylepis.1